tara:strand:- start:802 stop:960 length:159 start_codon:yes stop_codon:yes gene_type:complete
MLSLALARRNHQTIARNIIDNTNQEEQRKKKEEEKEKEKKKEKKYILSCFRR